MAMTSNDLDRFPTEECEKLANWAMDNFAFGPRVVYRKTGAWKRENLPMDGLIVMTAKVDYRDRMIHRWDNGVFRITLDRTGFPVHAEAATEARALASQRDFRMLSKLSSLSQLEAVHAPFSEPLDTMEPVADWALENIDIGGSHVAVPEGKWKVAREHGSVLFSRDVKFTPFTNIESSAQSHKKGTFYVAFEADGTPAGAWARTDSRPFALRERGHFPEAHDIIEDAHVDVDYESQPMTP
jgi:hypothetical protein